MEFNVVPLPASLAYVLKNWCQLCLAFLCLLSVIACYFKVKSQAINYWPFLGTLPSLLCNSNRLPEWFTESFISLGRASFFVEGPLFSNFMYLVTCHPQNIEYILKTNFSNFPKGANFKEVFEPLGDGILNADDESWRLQRKMAHACFSSAEFRSLVAKVSQRVVENTLVPFLAHVARQGSTIDLQEVARRITFDNTMSLFFGREEGYLSIDLPTNELAEAGDDAQEALLYRLAMPFFVWKFLRWLRIGPEKRLYKARRTGDVLFGEYISVERENTSKRVETTNLLSMYIKSPDVSLKRDTFLIDTMVNLSVASRDTMSSGLSWFLWLIAKTPRVEAKILEELKLVVPNNYMGGSEIKRPMVFDSDDLKDLVYLHAALCESMRLCPPLPFNSKGVIKEDVLPDGTVVKPGMQILISFYSEGRMPGIWGENSLEFKPERWIDNEGKLSHELMSKFYVFNIGPRSCLGKGMAFPMMKSVLAAIIFNFHVEVLEGQQIIPKPSINLYMKNGLMAKIKERAM